MKANFCFQKRSFLLDFFFKKRGEEVFSMLDDYIFGFPS